MKVMTCIRLALLVLVLGTTFASPALAEYRDEVWSIAYQLQRAHDLGLPLAPEVPLPLAILTGNPPPDTPDVRINNENDRHQSENSIAVSPNDHQLLLNSNNSTDFPVTELFGTSWFVSTDGGQTWTGDAEGPDGVVNNGDPAAGIDRDDRLFIGHINDDGGQGVSISTNLGTDWDDVAIQPGPPGAFDLLDKNHLTVDNSVSSAFEGRVYSAWTEFIDGGPNDNDIVFSFSTDAGSTWSAIANLSDGVAAGNHNQGVNIQAGPNGEVYVCWSIYDSFPADETAIGFNSSTDGGATFLGESRIIEDIRGIRSTTLPNESTRANSFPSMAVDVSGGARNGWIYIVWTNIGVPGTNTGDADIYMIRSTDEGATWSTPVRVNDDATTNAQWFPWATCDPVTGDLSVVFYDRRDDAGNLLTTAYVATSGDGGTTWTNFRVGDAQFTPAPIPGLATGYMGDYLGIAARDCHVYPVWSDSRVSPFTAYISSLVLDVTPPDITCPADITVECTGNGGVPIGDPAIQAFLAGATATDNCDATPTITHDAPPFFPLGPTVVTFTATDDAGNTDTCTATVTVEDTTPPTIEVTLNRTILWPPNHKLVTITADVVVEDICDDDPAFVLTSITSDEPDNGLGDGDRPDDIQGAAFGTPDVEFQLRSERQGGGDGREYTIVYTVTDGSGNATSFTVVVLVPHDMNGLAGGGAGYVADGTALEGNAASFMVVILGTPECNVAEIGPAIVQIGNHMGVIESMSRQFVHGNPDDRLDLGVVFPAEATRQLMARVDEDGTSPVALRYQSESGAGYLLWDIFAFGPRLEVITTGVPEAAPTTTLISHPQPNPFTAATRLKYTVEADMGTVVSIGVYNVAGQRVRTLVNALRARGQYEALWDGRDDRGTAVAAGVYFYQIDVGRNHAVRRVTLTR